MDMYARIAAAMPDDEEVQAFCAKHIAASAASAAKKEGRISQIMAAIPQGTFTTADILPALGEREDGTCWTGRGLSWYLSELVRRGELERVKPGTYKLA